MNVLASFIDIAPSAGIIGAGVAAAFFLVLVGVAFIAFKVLKKTVKMAFRLAVVGVILVVALVGSLSLWYFSSGSSPRPRPTIERKR